MSMSPSPRAANAHWQVYVYSKTVLDEAKTAVERGDKQTATRDAWAVAHFGELLRAQGTNEGERASSVEYSTGSNKTDLVYFARPF